MSQIKQIIEGWANVIKDQFNAVDIVTKTISKKRLELRLKNNIIHDKHTVNLYNIE